MLVLNQCCSEAPLKILFQQHRPKADFAATLPALASALRPTMTTREVALPCTALPRPFLGKSSGEDQVLLKIYCRKNVARIDLIKMLARKYLIQRLYISRKWRM